MYIVKVGYNEKFSSQDGFFEAKTKKEAIELYTKLINQYPNLLEIRIFESKEISIPESIKEEALARKKKEYEIKKEMSELGLSELEFDELIKETSIY